MIYFFAAVGWVAIGSWICWDWNKFNRRNKP